MTEHLKTMLLYPFDRFFHRFKAYPICRFIHDRTFRFSRGHACVLVNANGVYTAFPVGKNGYYRWQFWGNDFFYLDIGFKKQTDAKAVP